MSNNEFDRLVADKLKQATFTYNAGDWDKLSAQLAEARRKKHAIPLIYKAAGIAASLLVCVAGISLLLSNHKTITAVNIHRHTTRKIVTPAPIALPVPVSILTQNIAIISANKKIPGYTPVNNAWKTQSLADTADIKSAVNKTVAAPFTSALHDSESNPVPHTITTTKIAQADNTLNNKEQPVALPLPAPLIQEEIAVVKKNLHISVGGGVNYGTLNAGYALNAVADKRISNKMSIEVTMGYINNNGTATNSNYAANTGPSNIAHSMSNTISTVPLDYLQFSPVAGFYVSRNIVVGAGADVQRLLQNHETTVIYNDKEKIAPLTDVGLLLKTDYAVTTRLKGGVSYRIGANNVVSAGNNYIDRNYLQLQLKYRLH